MKVNQGGVRVEALESRRLLVAFTWIGDVDANWATKVSGNTNWFNDVLPGGGDLIFPNGSAPASNDNFSGLAVNAVQVNGTGSQNRRYVIGGNQLTLGGSTAVSVSAGPDAQGLGPRLTLPLKLAANTTFQVVNADTTLEVAGAITGAFNLNKSGAGTLVLSGTGNSFGNSSLPTVLGGTLRLGASNVFPDAQPLSVSAGATFDLNGFNERMGVLRPGAGTVNLGGAGTLTLGGAGLLGNFDGRITGTGNLTIDGSPQVLGGPTANTYTGTTTVKDGNLLLLKASGMNAVSGDLVIGVATGLPESSTVGLDGDGGNDEQVADGSNVTINATGVFFLASRTETIGSLAGQAGGRMHLGYGTLKVGGDRNTTFDGVIDDGSPGKTGTNGGNTLIKSGLGSLTLTANNPFTATTRLAGGTLFVNGSQTSSAVLLLGGTLGGAGSVGTVSAVNGGGLAPGGAAGTTAILRTRSLSLDGQTRVAFELNGLDPGTENDQLNVQGSVSLANATLDLKLAAGFTPGAGLSFVLINNDGSDAVGGTFNGLPEGAYFVVDGQTFRITYSGGTGNDVVLIRENGPAVASASYDFATAPRLVFGFTQNVQASLGSNDLLIRKLDDGSLVDPGTFTLGYNATSNTATFTHSGGPLADGNYRVTLNGAGVSNAGGVAIGAVTTLDFFAFAGDANRDRSVDFNDLVALAQNYNTAGKSLPQGDFNYDGRVDFNDLVLLAQRYNTSLPPPPVSGVMPGAGVSGAVSESSASALSQGGAGQGSRAPFSVVPVRRTGVRRGPAARR